MKAHIVSAIVISASLLAGSSYAASLNGPNPGTGGVAPQVGGGTTFGAAQIAASFNTDGTIIAGIGISKPAINLGPGIWEVDTNRTTLQGCVWTGSIGYGTFGGNAGAGFIEVTGRVSNTRALFVQTFNATATATTLPFEVHIICG